MNPGLWLIALMGIAALSAGSARLGYNYRDGEVAREKLAIAKAYADWAEREREIAHDLSSALATVRAGQAPKDRIITKEITRYVQVTPPDQRCVLPGTWRMRHDAAATGAPGQIHSGAGSVALGAGASVEDAAALETIADNYAIARECADKLDGWIERYHRLEATRPGAPR